MSEQQPEDISRGELPNSFSATIEDNGMVLDIRGPKGHIDFADTTMLGWAPAWRFVQFSITTDDPKWEYWAEIEMDKIESYVREDFAFDGYECALAHLEGVDQPCSTPLRYEIEIWAEGGPRYGD